ncbi:MAG: GH39 family glycosyl hydrolase [Ginsengibacter sp.]
MNKALIFLFLLIPFIVIAVFAQAQSDVLQNRIIKADFLKPLGKFSMMYEECVGAGRANEGLRADWQQQLRLVKKAIDFKYIRFHGLLCDDMHVYTEDKKGNSIYNWQYIDKLYDFLLSIGIRPFVELSFMPPDLASGTKTVFWWKGNVTPPKSYEKWKDLITALARHFEERYGKAEVEKWYFEVWNEPDLGGFWAGTMDDYFKLYQTTVTAIKSVSNTFKVGGPATARSGWIKPFLQFCADKKLPLDFVSTHSYDTKTVLDEFGIRKRKLLGLDYLSGNVKHTRKIIDSTSFKNIQLDYTEFNSSPSSRDPLHDSYQNASFILNTLKNTEHDTHSMSYWTFTDIFEEAGPAVTSFHGGFGLLNLQGIKKPTFFAYKFLHELGPTELINTDSSSYVCKTNSGIQVLFWNVKLPFSDTSVFNDSIFRENNPPKNVGRVSIDLSNIPKGKYKLLVYQIGYHHNDAFSAWLEMGSPSNISLKQEALLKNIASGKPVTQKEVSITDGEYTSQFNIRENDIYFIKLVKL